MDQIGVLLNRLGLARVAAMGIVAVMMMGFFVFLMIRASNPQMAPLYSGLALEDSSAIVAELQSSGVSFELRNDGETILVPRNEITNVRMTLAGQGLPTNGQIGYEIFDQQSTLGATSFVQDVNLVRALEGELSRTITSLNRVNTARVHLVLPKRELFRRERQDPTASITLGVRGALSATEIRAIQHMVSSAVEGMSPNSVSIIDGSGRLLAAGGAGSDETMIATELEERTVAVENRFRNSLEALLANVVGNGRARVQVTAELELTRLTRSSETFDPNGQVVRSSQLRELQNESNGESPGGAVTVGNELPNADANAANGTGANDQSSTTEETLNYEISKATETAISEAGAIKRLSVAVVLDGIYVTDAAGVSNYQARTEAELAQIDSLVKSAVGFDQDRGDVVEVVNMQFAERPDLIAVGTEAAGLFDFTRDDIMSIAEMAVTALIGLALILFVMRPLLKRVLTPEEPLELPQPEEGAMTVDQQIAAAQNEADESQDSELVSNAKKQGAAHNKTMETVGTLVTENPAQSATIVRDWLSEAA